MFYTASTHTSKLMLILWFQEHFLHVGEMVTSFQFTDEEFALLSALLLFPAEVHGLENPKAVEQLQNQISGALQAYEESKILLLSYIWKLLCIFTCLFQRKSQAIMIVRSSLLLLLSASCKNFNVVHYSKSIKGINTKLGIHAHHDKAQLQVA